MDELIAFSESVPKLVAWLTRNDFNHIGGDLRDRFARDYRLPEIVRLFEALFFKVRDRGETFRTGVMFPEARIGAVVEAEMN
jgi:hypothetical protein